MIDNPSASVTLAAAERLNAAARELSHQPAPAESPSDSYQLLGELSDTQRRLAHTLQALAEWTAKTRDGVDYDGEDPDAAEEQTAVAHSADVLRHAAALARDTAACIDVAHAANGRVRWFPSPRDGRAASGGSAAGL